MIFSVPPIVVVVLLFNKLLSKSSAAFKSELDPVLVAEFTEVEKPLLFPTLELNVLLPTVVVLLVLSTLVLDPPPLVHVVVVEVTLVLVVVPVLLAGLFPTEEMLELELNVDPGPTGFLLLQPIKNITAKKTVRIVIIFLFILFHPLLV